MIPTLLGGLTAAAFLRRYWQKRPLLVRGALPGFRDPVHPERLLALAARPGVEARLVLERAGTRPWQVVPGPLDVARLRRLPATRWTVLVHAVDAHDAGAAALRDLFSFVPRWRVDDVMVSYAARLGSVGPHVDSYDVFLLQGRGRRRWRIARRFARAHRPGLDLRVLRGFRHEQEWVLEPGDMLYLPPGVAHHGVALDPCLTYSIGFRAPGHVELVAGFLERVVRAVDRDALYSDPDLRPPRQPGRIDARAIGRMRAVVEAAGAAVRGPEFTRFVGEVVTEPRPSAARPARSPADRDVRRALRGGATLAAAPGARLAFATEGDRTRLFANGREWPLPRGRVTAGLAATVTSATVIPAARLAPFVRRRRALDALVGLVRAGVLRVQPSPHRASGQGRGGSRRAAGSRWPGALP